MSRMIVRLALTALAVLCLATAAPTAEVMAQGKVKLDKARLVGSWVLVSISNTGADGKATQTYGAGDGVLVFEANGRFIQVLARPDLPKFASNNRNAGSPEENKAVVQGSLSIYGSYTIGAKDGAVTLHVERGSFANWNGTDQKRVVTSLTANALTWDIAAPTIGGKAEAMWKRSR